MKSLILSKLFYILPKKIQNHLRCFFNNLLNKDFKVFFKKNYLHFIFSNNDFKCYANINTGIIIDEVKNVLKGYLKDYSLKKGDTILDVGGHIGIFSLYSSKLSGGSGKIIIFEPDKKNYFKIKQNIELNKFSNIIVVNKGVWNKDTSVFFSECGTAESSFGKDSEVSKKIPVVKLDNEIKRLNLKKIDFVKMDIEGAEINAIKGFSDFLKKNKTNLAIASYHIINGEKTCFHVEELLTKLGYKTETSFSKHLTTFARKD